MYFHVTYNTCRKYFSKCSAFSKINAKNHDFHGVLMVLTMKFGYLTVLTIIFVISVSKYANMGRIRDIVTKVGALGFSNRVLKKPSNARQRFENY